MVPLNRFKYTIYEVICSYKIITRTRFGEFFGILWIIYGIFLVYLIDTFDTDKWMGKIFGNSLIKIFTYIPYITYVDNASKSITTRLAPKLWYESERDGNIMEWVITHFKLLCIITHLWVRAKLNQLSVISNFSFFSFLTIVTNVNY